MGILVITDFFPAIASATTAADPAATVVPTLFAVTFHGATSARHAHSVDVTATVVGAGGAVLVFCRRANAIAASFHRFAAATFVNALANANRIPQGIAAIFVQCANAGLARAAATTRRIERHTSCPAANTSTLVAHQPTSARTAIPAAPIIATFKAVALGEAARSVQTTLAKVTSSTDAATAVASTDLATAVGLAEAFAKAVDALWGCLRASSAIPPATIITTFGESALRRTGGLTGNREGEGTLLADCPIHHDVVFLSALDLQFQHVRGPSQAAIRIAGALGYQQFLIGKLRHQVNGNGVIHRCLKDIRNISGSTFKAVTFVRLQFIVPTGGVTADRFIADHGGDQFASGQFCAESGPRAGVSLLAGTTVSSTTIRPALQPGTGWYTSIVFDVGHLGHNIARGAIATTGEEIE